MLFAADAREQRLGDSHGGTGRLPVLTVENDNILRQAPGLASGEAGCKLWDEPSDGLPLQTLRETTLGDWEMTLLDGSSAQADDARRGQTGVAVTMLLSNRYFGSRLLFSADGTLIWLSNALASKAVVLLDPASVPPCLPRKLHARARAAFLSYPHQTC